VSAPAGPGEPTGEVFVLGAGFSRAIPDLMPLTDDLGNEALKRDSKHLGRRDSKLQFHGGQFEAWLSRRAEPQPYLNSASAIENQAIFARTTALIAEILDERVEDVLRQSLPVWLGELLSVWHLRGSHVLTFNYDPLVECAFESMRLWDWKNSSHFQWGSLLNYSPEGKAGMSYGEFDGTSGPHPTFRLWKLHGSLNWLWVPGDNTGATVRRVRLPGTFGAPSSLDVEETHWSAPGRERFIVPPAALKSGYYANPITREIWQRAYSALSKANRITLMGYSVPQTDLSTSGMLAEALAGSTGREVNIVDRELGGGEIPARLSQLSDFGVTTITEHSGSDAIPRYVGHLVSAAAQEAVARLTALEALRQAPLYVDWGEAGKYPHAVGQSAAIVEVEWDVERRTLVLTSEQLDTVGVTTRSRSGDHESLSVLPAVADLILDRRNALRIALKVPGMSREIAVIDVVERAFDTGYGNGAWIQLVPAGACSD
jgi:hypothetical protein